MSTTRKTTKIPVFHTVTTKRNAVRRINAAMKRGDNKITSVTRESKALKVHEKTIMGWLRDSNLNKTLKATIIPPANDEVTQLLNSSDVNGVIKVSTKTNTDVKGHLHGMTFRHESGAYVKYSLQDARMILGSKALREWVDSCG